MLHIATFEQFLADFDDYDKYRLPRHLIDAIYNETVRRSLRDNYPADNDNLAINHASADGHTEVVRLLLADPRVDPGANNNWAIGRASENGHTNVVRLLLADPGVDPTARDNYAIRKASRNGHAEVVRLLLADPRVDPGADDNYAVRWARANGHTNVVGLLSPSTRVRGRALLPTIEPSRVRPDSWEVNTVGQDDYTYYDAAYTSDEVRNSFAKQSGVRMQLVRARRCERSKVVTL